MSVNPPADENFIDVETGETVVNRTGPDLHQLQLAQLAIYQANVEGREPDFGDIPHDAIIAAGYDPKKRKPLESATPEPGAPLPSLTEQTPIVTEDQQPHTADVIADPAKLGQAQADAHGQEAADAEAKAKAAAEAKAAKAEQDAKLKAETKAAKEQEKAQGVTPKKQTPAKKTAAKPLTRAQKAAAARKAAK
jgi:hypothetical protein